MTATKTAKLTVEQAVSDLMAAREKYDRAVRAVIADDPKVTPKDVAEAKDAIEFAELRLELAHESAAHAAEERRLARIRELTDLLTTGPAVLKAKVLVALEAKAVTALDTLFAGAEDYHSTVRNAAVELARLGDLPPNVEIDSSQAVRVDGVLIHGTENYASWPGNVLLGAIHRAVTPHYASLYERARDVANTAERVLAGGIDRPKVTATEQLAAQLDRLEERQA